MDPHIETLEIAIEEAEAVKRVFVKENPNGTGDQNQRMRLYAGVETARKALREYKRMNPQLQG